MTYRTEQPDHPEADGLLVLSAQEIQSLLEGKELKILDIVADAYQRHALGNAFLPHSLFLKFPDNEANRIIALPAYLGGGATPSAGIKWIASFPGNIQRGLDRASAVLILNSVATGRPKAIMEGSLISAKRTAASATLAARVLRRNETSSAAMVGCGLINVEIARFLCAAFPKLSTFYAYDADHDRALQYKEQCEAQFPGAKFIVLKKMRELLGSSMLVSFATTAVEPHVHDLSMCASGTVILHVSLRDIAPELVLSNDNIVDDVDHVCRAQTSVHLAEQKTGRRDFIRGTLGEILNGQCAARNGDRDVVIYSPFGLGILDVALGEYLFQQAVAKQIGLPVPSFFPHSWKRIPTGT